MSLKYFSFHKPLIMAMIMILVSGFLIPGNALSSSPTVFINEIHYDNTSTDTSEAVEIAGPANTDLSGWSLILYNGNGGAVYDTTALSGTIPEIGSKFGIVVVNYPTNGIQNGSPDGLALVDSSGNVIQFLSYEGSFVAVGGPADGMISTDIGVAEISDTPVGNSLQLNGSGRTYDDFTWSSAAANTFGAFNTGQTIFSSPPVVVINEIDYDQPGTDTAEFIELKNADTSAVDLSQFTLELVNGNGTVVYNTINLPSVILAAGDYFVVCANSAIVTNCDMDVSPDTNLLQNGAPDAVGLRFNGVLIDAVSYEGDTGAPYTEGSGIGLEDNPSEADKGISRCVDGIDTAQNNTDFQFTDITPKATNECGTEACGAPYTPIYTIQGSGLASKYVGSEVAVEGIVVGDFQNGKNGFFIQDSLGDANAATSDGIFVFSTSLDVNAGDYVRVRGIVEEYYGLTEISSVSQILICSTNNSLPPTELSLPVTSLDDFEAYEGMLVTFPQPLYISEHFNFDRFGEIVLTTGHQFQPTAVYEPSSAEAAQLAQDNHLGRITLDDGRSDQNPDPALHPKGSIFDLTNLFRSGDVLQNVTGIMDYAFGLYRVQPTTGADYTPLNLRTEQPDDVGGNLKVASFNLSNYFTTLNSRGANNTLEFDRQRTKIFAALAGMDADVVGLIEIENNSTAIQDLVNGLNEVVGAGTYTYVNTGVIGTDEITVALIYKPVKVSLVGNFAVLEDPSFTDPLGYGEQMNRPALAQTFIDNTTCGVFTLVVNHLKSKGSACGPGDDDPVQGNCNLTRTMAAQALVNWLQNDPTGSSDADFLIIGDMNSYDKEAPIDAIVAENYTDLIFQFLGEYAYSYVFDGQLGYLDHALANLNLLDKVAGLTIWHINSDEPDLINFDMTYKEQAQDALFEPNAYRSSDHDPVIIGLNVYDEICEGDFDTDGDVDGTDLFVFANDYGRTDCSGDCEGDFDHDGDVDGTDLFVFANDYGRTDCVNSDQCYTKDEEDIIVPNL